MENRVIAVRLIKDWHNYIKQFLHGAYIHFYVHLLVFECSWSDATDRYNILQCNDGYECDGAKHPRKWSCCRAHGGRAKCPRNSPLMCAERICAGRSDHCCSDHDTNCGSYYNYNLGGKRECGTLYGNSL